MPSAHDRVSLSDLAGAGIRLRPAEAVAIIREVTLQVVRGELPGLPSLHVIRLTASGAVTIEGPVAADSPDASRAAHLLESLLGSADAAPEFRPSGALRIVIARALGTLDLPPYASLSAFADALARFAASDVSQVVSELCATWSAYVEAGTITVRDVNHNVAAGGSDVAEPHQLAAPATISDVRRARRATRLTLAEIAERSRIPAWLLRELEWGYLRNWPAGLYGRTQLVRYARAAALDEEVVVRTVWPLLEEAERRRGTVSVAPEDLQPADPQAVHAAALMGPIERGPLVPTQVRVPARPRYPAAAALAITLLLVVALLPAAYFQWQERSTPATGGLAQRPGDLTALQTKPAARHVVEPPGFAAPGVATFHPDERPGVVHASSDGSTRLRITRVIDDGARNYHARLSPDSSRIAFDSDRDGERGVYVADADGRNVRRVSGDGFAALPAWSPDGRRLLFVRAEVEHPEVWNLWSVDLESGRRRRLTADSAGQPWGGSWFPDGRRVAYSRGAKLMVLDIETGVDAEYAARVRGRIRSLAVSPDGRHIVFQVVRDGVWLLSLSNGFTRRVLDDPTADTFSWAPDGQKLAYHSGRAGGWNVWVKSGT